MEQKNIFHSERFERDPEMYYISKILNYNGEHRVQLKLQQDLFRQLNISKFDWEFGQINSLESGYIYNLKIFLNQIEDDWMRTMTLDRLGHERFKYLTANTIYTSITYLEADINRILDLVDFDFKLLTNYQKRDIGQIVKKDILDLYHFVIKSRLIPRRDLLKLLYPITYVELAEEDRILGATSGYFAINGDLKSAMIGMDFMQKWYDEVYSLDLFHIGESASPDYCSTFVHEFGHAICLYYNLPPDLKEVLNLDIVESGGNESIRDKMDFHFKDQFSGDNVGPDDIVIEGNIGVHSLVQLALDYMMDFFANKYGNFVNHHQAILLLKWLVVPSSYGRTPLENIDYSKVGVEAQHSDAEWFAEGFSYYFTTPPENRLRIWEIWDNFFQYLTSRNVEYEF